MERTERGKKYSEEWGRGLMQNWFLTSRDVQMVYYASLITFLFFRSRVSIGRCGFHLSFLTYIYMCIRHM